MSAQSGPRSREPFAYYDPDTCSWKTCQPLLPLENLPEPPATWPRSGMWDLGYAYARPILALPTDATDYSSLLPTPDAYMGTRGGPTAGELSIYARKAAGHSVTLGDAVASISYPPQPAATGKMDDPSTASP